MSPFVDGAEKLGLTMLRGLVSFIARYFQTLTWPKFALLFVLIFRKRCGLILAQLVDLLKRVKSFDVPMVKAQLNELKEVAKEAKEEENVHLEMPIAASSEAQKMNSTTREKASQSEKIRVIHDFLPQLPGRPRRSPVEHLFILYARIETKLKELCVINGLFNEGKVDLNRMSLAAMTRALAREGIITATAADGLERLYGLRNALAHGLTADPNSADVYRALSIGDDFLQVLYGVPLPEYVVQKSGIGLRRKIDPDTELSDLTAVIVARGSAPDKVIPFVTSKPMPNGSRFTPLLVPSNKAEGSFLYQTADGTTKVVKAYGYEIGVLYEIL